MKKSSFSIGIFGDIWYAATGVVVVVMQGSNYVRKSEEVVNTIRIEKFNPPHFKNPPIFCCLMAVCLHKVFLFLLE